MSYPANRRAAVLPPQGEGAMETSSLTIVTEMSIRAMNDFDFLDAFILFSFLVS